MSESDFTENIINDRFSLFYAQNVKSKKSFEDDVIYGLNSNPKSLQPKYFYDAKGSELFEKICLTPEYYVTRTEAAILKEHSDDISAANDNKKIIVELGSGSSVKTRYILNSFIRQQGSVTYVPVDVSEILVESGNALLNDFEGLNVKGIIGEYEESLHIISENFPQPKIIVFLGSSIGNFDLPHAQEFLKMISETMNQGDSLLIGFDMVKDINILNAAYNDKDGVTAEFNLNLLRRIKNEFKADMDISNFEHNAFFNTIESRIEMHLVSKCDQSIKLNSSSTVNFKKGETIHTENSYKFTDEMIMEMIEKSGLRLSNKWNDNRNWFGLYLIQK